MAWAGTPPQVRPKGAHAGVRRMEAGNPRWRQALDRGSNTPWRSLCRSCLTFLARKSGRNPLRVVMQTIFTARLGTGDVLEKAEEGPLLMSLFVPLPGLE